MHDQHLGIRLHFELANALEKRCEALGVSKSEYIRMLIREALMD